MKELADVIYGFSNDRPVLREHNRQEHHLSMSLTIEAAEVMELEKLKDAFNDEEFQQKMGMELADVFIYLLELTRMYDVDLAACVVEKVIQNEGRLPLDEMQEGEFAKKYVELKQRNGERKI